MLPSAAPGPQPRGRGFTADPPTSRVAPKVHGPGSPFGAGGLSTRVPRHHLFVCTGPHCGERHSPALIAAFRAASEKLGTDDDIMVTNMGSVYLCDLGPVVLVYPDDVWYVGVQIQDCEAIVREHVLGGKPVERLRLTPGSPEERARQEIYRALFAAGTMDAGQFERLAKAHGFDAAWVEEQLKRRFINRSPDGKGLAPTAKMKERYEVR